VGKELIALLNGTAIFYYSLHKDKQTGDCFVIRPRSPSRAGRIYMVTCIIENDFESENLYLVNFINRQTLYRLIGMINKII